MTTTALLLVIAFGLAVIVANLRHPRLAVVLRTLRSAALHGVAILVLAGCAGVLPALAAASQGAQWLGTVLDMAEAGTDAYLARHPNEGVEAALDDAVMRARTTLAALDGLLAAGAAASQQDLDRARDEAVEAYRELYALLDTLGVLRARPPAGGAETSAPLPEPLKLPTPEAIEARLR